MRSVVVIVFGVACTACGFQHGVLPDGGVGLGSDSRAAGSDGQTSCVQTCTDAMTLSSCTTDPPTTCPLGCDGTPTDGGVARCFEPTPSNGADATTQGTGDLDITADATFDLSTYAITSGVTTLHAAGTGIDANGIRVTELGTDRVVLGVHSLTIEAGATLSVTSGARAVIVVATGDIQISGVLDVSAGISACGLTPQTACGGPGAGSGGTTGVATGCSPGVTGYAGTMNETGGGGGGFLTAGASGGDGSDGSFGGAGGAGGAVCTTAPLIPLVGGSGGGAGGYQTAAGGGGGGAVQLSALGSITISQASMTTAGIRASGAGGITNVYTVGSNGAGAGGSGGAILLEAQTVTLDGSTLAANSGAGGAGYAGYTTTDGEAGPFGSADAQGGTGADFGFIGGHGASLSSSLPSSGAGGGDGTGAGAGAIGAIRINAGAVVKTNAPVISPAETTGTPTGM